MEIEEKIGILLKEKGLTVAVAESCTGGLISSRITNISGASEYFMAGVITYSNKAKTSFLSVPEDVIERHGAVSHETAELMAEGVKNATGVDIGVSVTGIAGPMGGTSEKPVGTVFIGLASKEGVKARNFLFSGNRLEIKQKTSESALIFLKDYLEENHL
jgi:nicotinamide-nucleotide amidase